MPLVTSLISIFCPLLVIAWSIHAIWLRVMAYKKAGPGCSIIAVDPSHHLGFLWANPQRGKIGTMSEKYEPYARAGSLLLPAISLATPRTIFFVADPELIKNIATDKTGTFQKDPQTYSVLHVYGINIVGSDGAAWKKQRDVARAAFSEANVQLVWKESCKVSMQAVNQLQSNCRLGPVDVTEFMKKITLASTSASAFGRRIAYGKEATASIPPGYQLQFGEALRLACENMITRWATPAWVHNLPIPYLHPFLSRVRLAYQELEGHLQSLIAESRASIHDAKFGLNQDDPLQDDLLRRMVESNTLEVDPEKRLTDRELLSNVFIFLVAGHETTAHTISFILAHLALYPEVQGKVFNEIQNIWHADQDVLAAQQSYSDFPRFEYLLAVFRESLRHFPVAPRLPRVALKDTVLHSRARFATGPGSRNESFALPKGGLVVMDIMATHFNRTYWGDDAGEFRPERFVDTQDYRWPRDAFMPFSLGGRSCIGQRAGQAQTLCVVAHLIRYYKVSVPPHLVGLPLEKQRKILLRFWLGASLTPTDIKLTFTRRSECV